MSLNEALTLVRDVGATVIPAGDPVTLEAGTQAVISQALGGTVTLRTDSGLFRVAGKDWDALGEAAVAELEAQQASDPGISEADAPFSEEAVWDAMRRCFDPEIPVNIVDLRISEGSAPGKHHVAVKMTLTAQGCGMGPVIAEDAKSRIEALPAVDDAQVDIVWEPPWTPHMISESGRKQLGLD